MLGYQSLGFFFYSLYLYFQDKSASRLLFGFFMLSFGIASFLVHIHLFKHSATLFVLFPLAFCFGLTLIPLFYLHHKSLLSKDFQLKSIDLKHFVPFIVMLLLLTPFWVLITTNHAEYLDSVYGLFLLKGMPGRQTWLIEIIVKSAIVLQLSIYLYYGIKLHVNFRTQIRTELCNDLRVYISGIQIFALSFIILMALLLSHRFMHVSGDSLSSTLFISSLLVLNIGLSYFGIRFDDNYLYDCYTNTLPSIQSEEHSVKKKKNEPDTENKKYKASCLCKDLKEELLAGLLLLMKEKEPFVNSKIRIDDVADMMGTNTKYLSQLINEHFGKNFHAFLNDYRCAKVIELFHDPAYDDYSIEGIAETCGFNSRSTFVTSFKRFSGKLPSVYRSAINGKVNKK
ncbi:MAG: helix-turn-helix domain-containing protein [Bacteroidetes bacterium]|nr:helix-turn-helix domain-containing protein [Bacteroidota bacterium]